MHVNHSAIADELDRAPAGDRRATFEAFYVALGVAFPLAISLYLEVFHSSDYHNSAPATEIAANLIRYKSAIDAAHARLGWFWNCADGEPEIQFAGWSHPLPHVLMFRFVSKVAEAWPAAVLGDDEDELFVLPGASGWMQAFKINLDGKLRINPRKWKKIDTECEVLERKYHHWSGRILKDICAAEANAGEVAKNAGGTASTLNKTEKRLLALIKKKPGLTAEELALGVKVMHVRRYLGKTSKLAALGVVNKGMGYRCSAL